MTETIEWSEDNILCPTCEAVHYIGTHWIKLYKSIYAASDDPIMDQMQGLCYIIAPFAGYSPAICASKRLARTWVADNLEVTLNKMLDLDNRYLCTFLF